MKYSLRAKLSISYIFIAMSSVLILSILANVFLESQFEAYVKRKQQTINENTVDLISQQYKGPGKWDGKTIETIGMNALEQGLIIKVSDAAGHTVWDATVHNNGLCMQMLSHMAQNMKSRYRDWNGGYVETNYPVMYDFRQVGDVDIGYFGPFYFNDNDLAFINTLNKILIWVGVFSFFLALGSGALMARRLSNPISRVTKAAQLISDGSYSERIHDKTDTREIGQLMSAINELADNLGKQDILRKRMSADVAHELRTPLATLQSHIEAMIDGIWAMDVQRLKSCHEEIMRISRLVGDLERLAKYESENLVLNKKEFDVSELVRSLLNNFEAEFAAKGVHIGFTGQAVKVFADRDKISQVIINLVSNALKYTPEGGSVEVFAIDRGDGAELSVKDSGTGIPPEDIPFIFERFYRADKSRNRITGGSGIGLAIVKSIVDAHKGTISVCSEPGKGSQFSVVLPAVS